MPRTAVVTAAQRALLALIVLLQRAHLIERKHKALDRLFGCGDLGGAHLREVFFLQDLAVRHRQPGLDLHLRRLALDLPVARHQRLMDALGARRRLFLFAWRLR